MYFSIENRQSLIIYFLMLRCLQCIFLSGAVNTTGQKKGENSLLCFQISNLFCLFFRSYWHIFLYSFVSIEILLMFLLLFKQTLNQVEMIKWKMKTLIWASAVPGPPTTSTSPVGGAFDWDKYTHRDISLIPTSSSPIGSSTRFQSECINIDPSRDNINA